MALFCQVSTDSVQLHIDGEIVAEKPLSSSFCKASMSNSRTKITLVGSNMQGYVHDAKILPLNLSIKDHYHKVLCYISWITLFIMSKPCFYFLISQIYLFYSRTHHFYCLSILRLPLRLKKTVMVFGALLVERLDY